MRRQIIKEKNNAEFLTQSEVTKKNKEENKRTRHFTYEERLESYKKNWKQKKLNYYVMRFYQFNHIKHKFERQHESFYMVVKEDSSGVFTNDVFATLRNNTYFFRKDLHRNCFYLYRHRMKSSPINGA